MYYEGLIPKPNYDEKRPDGEFVPVTAVEEHLYSLLLATRLELQMLAQAVRSRLNYDHPIFPQLPSQIFLPYDCANYALYGDSRRHSADTDRKGPDVPGFNVSGLKCRADHLTEAQVLTMFSDLANRGRLRDLEFRIGDSPDKLNVLFYNGDATIVWTITYSGVDISQHLAEYNIYLPVEQRTVDIKRDLGYRGHTHYFDAPSLVERAADLLVTYYKSREWPLDWREEVKNDFEFECAVSLMSNTHPKASRSEPVQFTFRDRTYSLVETRQSLYSGAYLTFLEGEREIKITPTKNHDYMRYVGGWDNHLEIRTLLVEWREKILATAEAAE